MPLLRPFILLEILEVRGDFGVSVLLDHPRSLGDKSVRNWYRVLAGDSARGEENPPRGEGIVW
jgi:hypothetical protein